MMERALKERIIGAAVLVVVVVLIVPVFLDGPPGESEVVSTNVPLPGQSQQDRRTVVLDRDREDPVPASTSSDSKAPTAESTQVALVKDDKPASVEEAPKSQPKSQQPDSQQPEVQQPEAKPTPSQALPDKAPKASEPAASSSATGMWAVQLGSFSDQKNAERLATELRKQGFAAFLSQLRTDAGQLQRVRIGPQKDRQSAEAMAERLRKAGYNGKVLPHP
jgi:DedD protein